MTSLLQEENDTQGKRILMAKSFSIQIDIQLRVSTVSQRKTLNLK